MLSLAQAVPLSGAGKKAAAKYGIPLLGTLALDPTVPPSSDSGEPVSVSAPKSPTALAFKKIAEATDPRHKMVEAGPTKPLSLQWESQGARGHGANRMSHRPQASFSLAPE